MASSTPRLPPIGKASVVARLSAFDRTSAKGSLSAEGNRSIARSPRAALLAPSKTPPKTTPKTTPKSTPRLTRLEVPTGSSVLPSMTATFSAPASSSLSAPHKSFSSTASPRMGARATIACIGEKATAEPWTLAFKLTALKSTLADLDSSSISGWKAAKAVNEVSNVIFDIIDCDSSGWIDRREAKIFQDVVSDQCALWKCDLWEYDLDGNRRLSKEELNKFLWGAFRSFGKKPFLAQMSLAVELLKNKMEEDAPRENKKDEDVFAGLRSGIGCIIPLVEERGMLRGQLRKLIRHVDVQCEQKKFIDVNERSATCGQLLQAKQVNLYQVVDLVVKPATQNRKCSYVEVVAKGPQRPLWFVSHWWGEPVVEFLACLEQHAADRELASTDPYWVCAYANNQWDLSGEVVEDPKNSSFRRAMDLAEGTISVLDAKAVCYSRIWCCYEVWVSTSHQTQVGPKKAKKPYLYDMYTAKGPAKACGITDGCAEIDKNQDFPMEAKMQREKQFPMELCTRALTINLQKAQASQDADRRRILNSIAGARKIDGPPPDRHEKYDQLNHNLHGRVAIAVFRSALENGEDMTPYLEALRNCNLPQLEMSLFDCKHLKDDTLSDLASTITPNVEAVLLDFSHCLRISNQGLKSLSAGLLESHSLRRLSLSFICCKTLTDDGLVDLGAALNQSPALRECCLNFYGCKKIKSFGARSLIMNLPTKITHLELDLSFTAIEADVIQELVAHSYKELQDLRLRLQYCTNALTEESMVHIVKTMPRDLSVLHLDLRCGDFLNDAAAKVLAEGIPHNLKELCLDLACCKGLTDDAVDMIAKAIPTTVQHLEIFLGRCNIGDASARSLGKHIPPGVTSLTLKFTYCVELSLNGVRYLVRKLPKTLENITMWMDYTSCADEARELLQTTFGGSETSVNVVGVNCLTRTESLKSIGTEMDQEEALGADSDDSEPGSPSSLPSPKASADFDDAATGTKAVPAYMRGTAVSALRESKRMSKDASIAELGEKKAHGRSVAKLPIFPDSPTRRTASSRAAAEDAPQSARSQAEPPPAPEESAPALALQVPEVQDGDEGGAEKEGTEVPEGRAGDPEGVGEQRMTDGAGATRAAEVQDTGDAAEAKVAEEQKLEDAGEAKVAEEQKTESTLEEAKADTSVSPGTSGVEGEEVEIPG